MTDDEIDFDSAVIQTLTSDPRSEEILHALADPYACYTIQYVYDHPDTTLTQIADIVAGFDATASETVATPADREEIVLELYHRVLPMLDDAGLIDFDPNEQVISSSDIPPAVYALFGLDV